MNGIEHDHARRGGNEGTATQPHRKPKGHREDRDDEREPQWAVLRKGFEVEAVSVADRTS